MGGARTALDDGWHPLPSGGFLEVRDGRPMRLSDGGHQSVEERRLLEEAEAACGAKLNMHPEREHRWRRASLVSVLRHPERAQWRIALVGVAACIRCCERKGREWLGTEAGREWVCEVCGRELRAGEPW